MALILEEGCAPVDNFMESDVTVISYLEILLQYFYLRTHEQLLHTPACVV
jgi:hypothetical protein